MGFAGLEEQVPGLALGFTALMLAGLWCEFVKKRSLLTLISLDVQGLSGLLRMILFQGPVLWHGA